MSDLFLNFLRTSLVIGLLALILAVVGPLWNRRFGARWKKRLWCLLAGLLLVGTIVSGPENATIMIPLGTAGGPVPAVAAVQPEEMTGGEGLAYLEWQNAGLEAPDVQQAGAGSGAAGLPATNGSSNGGVPFLNAAQIVELLWAAGLLLFLLLAALRQFRFCRYLKRWAGPTTNRELQAAYAAACAGAGARNAATAENRTAARPGATETDTGAAHSPFPTLHICPGIGSPLLVGLLRPKLLLPGEHYTTEEAAYIFRHELTHFQQGDLYWKLLLLLANALHWFNPAVWLLRREAALDMERACDEAILKGATATERKNYGRVLLAVAERGRRPALSTYFGNGAGAMKERLRGILSVEKPPGRAPALLTALLSVALLCFVSCTQAAVPGQGDPPGQGSAPTPDAANIEDYTRIATLPLSDAEIYNWVVWEQASRAELPERDASDIAEILAEYTWEDGRQVFFYRSLDGMKYCASRQPDSDSLCLFTEEDNAYEDYYIVEPFTEVFGHDGFRIGCPRGAAYYAYDYYYFDESGIPRLLVDCSNYVVEQDLNGDGAKELLWFYHGRESYYYFQREGAIYLAYVDAMLEEALPDWTVTEVLPEEMTEGCLPVHYQTEGGGQAEYGALLRFTESAIEVLVAEGPEVNVSQAAWRSAQFTVIAGEPCIRYSDEAEWTAIGPAIEAPGEWADQVGVGGRDTATTLIGEPEIRMGLVSKEDGWLLATYGRGMAAADSYVYRSHDGGTTWKETGQLPAAWHPCGAAFLSDQYAAVAIGLFEDAPVFLTADGGKTWTKRLFEPAADVSVQTFQGILGRDGFVFSVPYIGGAWYMNYYYAAEEGSFVCIAESWGGLPQADNYAVDLDGDGQRELVCNVVYNADGGQEALVYRRGEDGIQVAYGGELADVPWEKVNGLAYTQYLPAGNMLETTYWLVGEEEAQVLQMPLDLSALRFQAFVPEEAW